MADTVLLIDDDADVLRAVSAYLERTGAEVTRAGNAEEGAQAFERLRPDVVILDLHLSRGGGRARRGEGAAQAPEPAVARP